MLFYSLVDCIETKLALIIMSVLQKLHSIMCKLKSLHIMFILFNSIFVTITELSLCGWVLNKCSYI